LDREVAAIAADGGDVDHIVIVGGDGVVPMAAVPDLTVYSNESTFARDVLTGNGESNEVAAALGSGYLLSDDPYATPAGISVLNGDHELYVPERSIGRLVEEPWQIIQQLDNFQTYDGLIDPATLPTAAVTGYDFLTDGAQAVADGLDGALATSRLISDAWNDLDFLGLIGAGPYDVLSPNAHFDFESLLPAAADAAGYYTADQLVDATEVAGLDTTVVFTMGCHAGLSVSDVQLGFAAADWAETFAQGDNPFIGHTTYGYGDTEIVAYSERLAAIYAEYLAQMVNEEPGAPASLGEALQRTKTDYLASTLVLTPYDEKVMQSFTYYGLPMYTIGEPTTGSTDELIDSVVRTAESLIASASTPAGPVTFGDPLSGDRVPVTIELELGERGPAALDLVETDDGDYYTVDGSTVAAPYRPIQPLVDVPIPPRAGGYQGFLITGLTSIEYEPFDVRYSTPIKDSSEIEGLVESQDASFPSTLQRVSGPIDDQRLLVAAGQFQAAGGAQVQRLFTDVAGELLPYAGSGAPRDDVAPGFVEVEGFTTASVAATGRPGVRFEIDTDADATRVVVVFRETDGVQSGVPSVWRSVELANRSTADGVDSWFGSAALAEDPAIFDVEFFVQVVDAAGNVGVTSNKIENFLASDDDGDDGLGFAYTGVPAGQFDSFFASPALFELQFDGVEVQDAVFSIDSGRLIDYSASTGIAVVHGADPDDTGYETSGTVVADRGAHILFGELPSGERAYRFFILDPDAPSLAVTPATLLSNQPVEVTIAADDGSGSGVASTTASVCVVSGATCQPVSPAPTITDGVLTLSTEGLNRLTVTSTDNVANASSVTVEVRIDTVAPTLSVTADKAPAVPGGFVQPPVVVTLAASDVNGSGVDRIDYSVNGAPASFAGESTTLNLTASATITATAYDEAGNPSTQQSLTVNIDGTVPT
ncbi:MAG: hypothetical protein MUE78_12140, partial [Ilumatobacteraceae bacterium]|nr:hypothetical protein [Ilumatobacteraceae bacterium]